MAVRNLRSFKPKSWIPPLYSGAYKIVVVRADGTEDDITSICHVCEVNDGVTSTIGQFYFEIWNPNETYTDVWTGFEVFKFYADYTTTTPTTLRFRGRIEKISYSNNMIKVNGRSESLRFMEITVTKSYDNQKVSDILIDLVNTYNPGGFTTTNIQETSTTLTVNWSQKPFWDAVTDLCTASNSDCYVDSELGFRLFSAGSVKSRKEAMLHDYNIMDIREFAEDITFVKNRIIVYGANQEGVQIIYTAEDTDSQDAYTIREDIINDDNVTNETQAQELGDYHLAAKKDAPLVGEVTSIILPTLQPGEQLKISEPQNNIEPKYYDILGYKHKVGTDGMWTTVKVNKSPRNFSHILKSIIESDNKKNQTSINPHELRFSYSFLFNEDEGTHTNTEITDSVLKATVAGGDWVSPTRDLGSNRITEGQIIANGQTLTSAVFEVSGDGGTTYQTLTRNTLTTIGNATGSSLRVRVTLNSTDTQIESLSLQYKTTPN